MHNQQLHGPIRIFEIGHHLDSALDCPTSGPRADMAFRFLPEYGPAGFRCCDCGAVRLFNMGTPGGTGYARVDGNQLCCYECADSRRRAEMLDRSRPFSAYISGENGATLTTWTGGLLGHVAGHSTYRNNWGALIHCYSVRDVHGGYWHGRNSGPGMCITLRPSKG